MYRYCKSSEQQELTLFGFVAGHLLNLDGMSDVRDHHDTRKSHATPPKHHQHVKVYGVVAFVQQPSTKSLSGPVHKDYARDEFYLSDYQSDIFHPPSV